MASWYEVYSVVDGAIDETREPLASAEVDEVARSLASDVADDCEGHDWEVYVLPHYCDRASGEACECASWLQDHRPAYTSLP